MAGNTVNLPQHFQGASPGTAMVGANTRVKGQPGFMGTQTDSLLFADGTGSWVVPNTRTRILGTFMISQSSQGLEATTSGPVVPILVVMGDARVRSL